MPPILPDFRKPLSEKGLVVVGPLPANADGHVVLDGETLKFDPSRSVALVVQADTPYSVEVQGPSRVWAPYPGSAGALANEVTIVRGRWLGIRVVTTGNVWAQTDRNPDAWSGVY